VGWIGLLLAIPITAGIKTVCDNVPGFEPYGRIRATDPSSASESNFADPLLNALSRL